jgi:hypothetical protein
MEDHIWRVQIITGVMAGSALLQCAAAVAASLVLVRRPSRSARAMAAAAFIALLVACGMAIRTTATHVAGAVEIQVGYIDPGPLGYVAPSLFALFAWRVGNRLLRGAWTSRPAFLYYAWLVLFTAANTINYCSPGWCMTMGFPFPWHFWSDRILEGAPDFTLVLEVTGAILDLTSFAAAAFLFRRWCFGTEHASAGRIT